MKRRSRSWLAARAANASSSRSSMRLTQPEAPDLGARIGRLDAVREVAAGDRGRRMAHAVQREQADAYDDQREAADQLVSQTVALAWLLQRSPNILLIPGTSPGASICATISPPRALKLSEAHLRGLNAIAAIRSQ